MEHAKWLEECSIDGALADWVPVDLSPECSLFHITLFPDEKKMSDYHIYFTLSGLKDEGRLSLEQWQRKGQDFFRGNLPGGAVRLREFALCYPREPRSKIERFTRRGVGLWDR
jgi:hypothetical protein